MCRFDLVKSTRHSDRLWVDQQVILRVSDILVEEMSVSVDESVELRDVAIIVDQRYLHRFWYTWVNQSIVYYIDVKADRANDLSLRTSEMELQGRRGASINVEVNSEVMRMIFRRRSIDGLPKQLSFLPGIVIGWIIVRCKSDLKSDGRKGSTGKIVIQKAFARRGEI